MIECFAGRIGQGKTFSAVERGLKYVACGGTFCSNIELVPDGWDRYTRNRWGWTVQEGQLLQIQEEDMGELHKVLPRGTSDKPVLVFIDEAHLWFNSRDWAKQSRDFLNYLTLSRRFHVDLVFVSQHPDNVDKQVRRLIQHYWYFRDMSKYRVPVLDVSWPLKQILQCQYDQDGRTLLNRRFVAKDPAIFECYNSFQMIREFPQLKNEGVTTDFGNQGKVKRGFRMSWKLVVLLIVVGLMFAGCGVRRLVKNGAGVSGTKPIVEVEVPAGSLRAEPEPRQLVRVAFVQCGDRVKVDTWEGRLELGGWYRGKRVVGLTKDNVRLMDDGGNVEAIPLVEPPRKVYRPATAAKSQTPESAEGSPGNPVGVGPLGLFR